MAKDPFLLVSLEENESKALAQVMSNDTARKILDFLSKDESATETDIANKLKVPLSTVHYNLQALVKANLVKAEEFHYSEKGKEVLHYSLANKLIIIAPKNTRTESFRDKLRGILPVALITLAVGAVIQLLNKFMFRAGEAGAKLMAAAPSAMPMAADYAARGAGGVAEQAIEKAAVPVAEEAGGLMMTAASDSAEMLVENATNITQNITETVAEVVNEVAEPIARPVVQVIQQTPPTNIAMWFLIGAGFTIVLLIIWYWFVTRKKA
ncbi:helix-turn-helix domain-containing protein [Candidatus Woesearchaeota archaeon]|nr:helix-turn-helix domain-containing protein [Candidatus Woesearchaeota archaeon]